MLELAPRECLLRAVCSGMPRSAGLTKRAQVFQAAGLVVLEMLVLVEERGRRRRRIVYNIMVSSCGILSEQATDVEVVN